ncbi:hypothetical protein [Nocardiopsis ganjiahuensis]|uniref:hypothetical protein n=1 Tax=Nocardiopsis ganjiahuensis TaxID=239984 RepID=UPI000344E898|nr:hypothetical protein [Nocardiopsis ganjiahuensis]
MSRMSNAQRAAKAHAKATGTFYRVCREWAEQGFLSNRKALAFSPDQDPAEAVRLCAKATRTPEKACLEWAEQGFISKLRPVPDACSPRQRSLEAFLVHVLANAFRDEQLDSVALGLVRVDPLPAQPVLHLHPEMANTVVRELLPHYDHAYQGVRGLPGLRPDLEPGQELEPGQDLILIHTAGGASVRLRHPDPEWSPTLPDNTPQDVQLWRSHPKSPGPRERPTLAFWLGENELHGRKRRQDRDWLLSRLLRRPGLLNITGRSHPWVNTYTHAYLDVVFEWCCGTVISDVADSLLHSGVVAATRDSGEGEISTTGTLKLGEARATLRCQTNCRIDPLIRDQVMAENLARHSG